MKEKLKIKEYDLVINQRKRTVLKEKQEFEVCYDDASMNNPNDVAKLMNKLFNLSNQAEEHTYLIATTTKCQILGIFEISHGSVKASILNPREVFVRLCLIGAASFFLVHNHPSGVSDASTSDFDITTKIKNVSELMKFDFLDHIIVGDKNFFSFKKKSIIL